MRKLVIALVAAIGTTGSAWGADVEAGCPQPPTAYVHPAIAASPLTVRILQDSLVAVPATDGLVHLAYAAQVTNAQPNDLVIESVTPVDPVKNFTATGTNQPVDPDNLPIAGKVRLRGDPDAGGDHYETRIPATASGLMFFDVAYPNGAKVPALLSHRVVVIDAKTKVRSRTTTDPIPVRCEKPVVLSPPLIGHGWWNVNGCCHLVYAHRNAALPIGGDFKPAQQFAIDYVQVDAEGKCCTGPAKYLKSWPFYGAPVLAVAAGKVVEVVTDQPEQIPGPPIGVTLANAAGNHIIQDIGNGRFVMYAHLKVGSVAAAIKPGAMLRVGQQIGEVGNTGSSTAPHLHFQVMDRPSTLNAVGLPFVFDTQALEGRVTGPLDEDNQEYDGGLAVKVAKIGPYTLVNRMSAESQIFGYHLK